MKFTTRFAAVLPALVAALCLVPHARAAGVITLQVTAEQANVREKPDIASAVLKQIVTGGILEAERKVGEWYEVKVDLDTGGTVLGYVHESLVRVVAGAPEPKQQQNPPPQPPPTPVKEAPPSEVRTPPAEPPREPQESRRRNPPPPTRGERPPREPRTRESGLASVSVWYGGRYAVLGDLNDGAKGQAAYFASALGVKDPNTVGSVHVGRVMGAEYRHPLVRALDVAIGVEYFSAERTSNVNLVGGSAAVNFRTTPRASVIPVSLSLVFYPVSNVYVKTGLDLSFARCRYLYRFEQGSLFQQWSGVADSVGLGYILGAGLDWRLGGPVSILAEANYRSSRIGGFDGEETYSESGKTDVPTKGSLYFFRVAATGGATLPQVFIRTAVPSGSGITGARPAELSLSGVTLRVGLKIAF